MNIEQNTQIIERHIRNVTYKYGINYDIVQTHPVLAIVDRQFLWIWRVCPNRFLTCSVKGEVKYVNEFEFAYAKPGDEFDNIKLVQHSIYNFALYAKSAKIPQLWRITTLDCGGEFSVGDILSGLDDDAKYKSNFSCYGQDEEGFAVSYMIFTDFLIEKKFLDQNEISQNNWRSHSYRVCNIKQGERNKLYVLEPVD